MHNFLSQSESRFKQYKQTTMTLDEGSFIFIALTSIKLTTLLNKTLITELERNSHDKLRDPEGSCV